MISYILNKISIVIDRSHSYLYRIIIILKECHIILKKLVLIILLRTFREFSSCFTVLNVIC
uniref:Uncharacterized protein n=1 Tax=virus sp. ctx9V1 TaxID=2828001 RepID=A0A8S5RCX7_9VIRU|nr:MAG TPA: hypothetical protein [virus sp. ctx9V1]